MSLKSFSPKSLEEMILEYIKLKKLITTSKLWNHIHTISSYDFREFNTGIKLLVANGVVNVTNQKYWIGEVHKCFWCGEKFQTAHGKHIHILKMHQ